MFPSNDGKKIKRYRPSASQKNVIAVPLKWYFLIKGPRFFGSIDRKFSENYLFFFYIFAKFTVT